MVTPGKPTRTIRYGDADAYLYVVAFRVNTQLRTIYWHPRNGTVNAYYPGVFQTKVFLWFVRCFENWCSGTVGSGWYQSVELLVCGMCPTTASTVVQARLNLGCLFMTCPPSWGLDVGTHKEVGAAQCSPCLYQFSMSFYPYQGASATRATIRWPEFMRTGRHTRATLLPFH